MTIQAKLMDPTDAKILPQDTTAPHAQIAGLQLAEYDQITPSGIRTKAVEVMNVTHGSAAWLSGLFPGDVITHINKQSIGNLDALTRVLGASKKTDSLLLTVLRHQQKLFLVISNVS